VWFASGPPLSGVTDRFGSFVGGRPALPEDAVPRCGLCGAPQTFSQIAFPAPHSSAGRSPAVFACTRRADDVNLIPPMLEGALACADAEHIP
jgi:hypothetical protein